MSFVAGELPERETEDIEAIIAHHSFVVENGNIPEGFGHCSHFGNGGFEIWNVA